jgi:hypothetical protein
MIPNLIHCTLKIKASREVLEEIRRALAGCDPSGRYGTGNYNVLCFNNFFPVPDDFYKNPRQEKLEEYRKALWGCLSNAEASKLKESRFELVYTFVVAKSLPMPILQNIANCYKNSKIELTYVDERKYVQGFGLNKDGKFIVTEKGL